MRYVTATEIHVCFLSASPTYVQAKENTKVKEAFQTLVQKILLKSPKAGQDSDGAAGVFGGGKADT